MISESSSSPPSTVAVRAETSTALPFSSTTLAFERATAMAF
jgi:hypothetical protein